MVALTNFTIDQIADYLVDGFWDYQSFFNFSFNMTAGGNNGVLLYNYSGFSDVSGVGTDLDGLSAERRALVDHAFDYLGEILGITFVATTSQTAEVDFFFKDNEGGAYANSEVLGFGSGSANHRYINPDSG